MRTARSISGTNKLATKTTDHDRLLLGAQGDLKKLNGNDKQLSPIGICGTPGHHLSATDGTTEFIRTITSKILTCVDSS